MKTMQKLLKWLLMLNKRLYKKTAFVVILALIPIFVLAFSFVAERDSGFLNIILVRTDSSDAVSSQVVNELLSEDSIINFTESSSTDEALDAVKTGRADEVWIFPADTQEKINQFAQTNSDSVITIVAREQTVFLRLSHEKLTAALYKYCAKAYYVDFARTNVPKLDSLTDEELIQYFDETSISEELFVFGSPNISASTENAPKTNYLTSPIRGLLSILVVLCGMAAVLYYMQDENLGTFSRVSLTGRNFVAFGCVIIAVFNVAAVVLVSLFAAGLASSIFKELLNLVLYSVCCTVFCMVLKQFFKNIRLYGSVIPLFTVVMIAVCPVFFDFRGLLCIQLLFPPTYYVNAVYDNKYLLYMVVYSLTGAVIYFLLQKMKKTKRRLKQN